MQCSMHTNQKTLTFVIQLNKNQIEKIECIFVAAAAAAAAVAPFGKTDRRNNLSAVLVR